MTDTIRIFVAIELPNEVKEALSHLLEELRGTNILGLRLVRPEGIHLTLKFLGDVPKYRVESIIETVSKAVNSYQSFELGLGDVGAFPNRNRPRVLWVGVDGDMERLNELQRQVDDALAQLGFDKEKRGFNPHLTIARIREETTIEDKQRAFGVISSASIKKGLKIQTNSLSLMRSTLKPDGAMYDCLASMPLLCDSRSSEQE